ncbi:MAG: lamin tail domain-containing protein [Bacteroidia bacterium]|nr:lamin tail domain-containing protein [Bacteroidia bacterium]
MKYISALLILGALLTGFILPNFPTQTTTSFMVGDIVINEFMASNDSSVADTAGEYDDWIELYNKGSVPVDLTGFYLSDKFDNQSKWQIDTTFVLQADSYLIIWADENGSQGPFHANFKLSAAGESIYLSDSTGSLLDSVNFSQQTTDMSMARNPNGTGNFSIGAPTFNANNDATSRQPDIAEEDFLVFPNPARDRLRIEIEASELRDELIILNMQGQEILKRKMLQSNMDINTDDWPRGFYFLQYKGLTRKIQLMP